MKLSRGFQVELVLVGKPTWVKFIGKARLMVAEEKHSRGFVYRFEVWDELTVVRLVGRVAASIIQINVEVFYALVCFEAKAVIYFHAVVSSTLIGMHGHGAVTAASKQRCQAGRFRVDKLNIRGIPLEIGHGIAR